MYKVGTNQPKSIHKAYMWCIDLKPKVRFHAKYRTLKDGTCLRVTPFMHVLIF